MHTKKGMIRVALQPYYNVKLQRAHVSLCIRKPYQSGHQASDGEE